MSSLLKKSLLVALIVPSFAFAQVSLDKVVATVAGEPVTAQEVQERANINLGILKREGRKLTNKAQENQLMNAAFNELLEHRVLLHQARKVGISVSEADVSAAITELAQAQGATVEMLKANMLKIYGSKAWDVFNRDVKNDLTINRLRKQEVVDKIKITPAEIDTFLEQNKMGANNPLPKGTIVETRHIFVEKTNAAAMKKIQAAKARIAAGETFETVAAAVSETGEPANTPVFISLNDGNADPSIRAAVKDLADGTVSDIIKTKNGLHLFKAIAHKTMDFTLEQQKDYAKQVLTEKKAGEDYQTWYKSLMEDAQKNLIEIKK